MFAVFLPFPKVALVSCGHLLLRITEKETKCYEILVCIHVKLLNGKKCCVVFLFSDEFRIVVLVFTSAGGAAEAFTCIECELTPNNESVIETN